MKNNYIETDLSKIEYLASEREDENFRFRSFLKRKDGKQVDRIVHRLHREITGHINCTLCGNCCYRLKPESQEEDIAILARIENITPDDFEHNYCEDDYGDTYLNTVPCRYLEGKKCRIYEHRPEQCRRFPSTDREGFVSKSLGLLRYYEICPIVFNIMERLKDEMKFRR